MPDALQRSLLDELNHILRDPGLYAQAPFNQLELEPRVQSWIRQNPRGQDLVRLNRRLMETAFPDKIKSSQEIPFIVGGEWNIMPITSLDQIRGDWKLLEAKNKLNDSLITSNFLIEEISFNCQIGEIVAQITTRSNQYLLPVEFFDFKSPLIISNSEFLLEIFDIQVECWKFAAEFRITTDSEIILADVVYTNPSPP